MPKPRREAVRIGRLTFERRDRSWTWTSRTGDIISGPYEAHPITLNVLRALVRARKELRKLKEWVPCVDCAMKLICKKDSERKGARR